MSQYTMTPDVVRLFAALAGGAEPDEICPIIADALEESGHELAPVVRDVLPYALRWLAPPGGAVRRPCPEAAGGGWTRPMRSRNNFSSAFHSRGRIDTDIASDLPRAIHDRVSPQGATPAAAYLALAAAVWRLLPFPEPLWDPKEYANA